MHIEDLNINFVMAIDIPGYIKLALLFNLIKMMSKSIRKMKSYRATYN